MMEGWLVNDDVMVYSSICALTLFPHLLLAADNKLRLSEFGLSRWAGTLSCRLSSPSRHTLNSRWMPPETLKELIFSKHSDVW